MSIAIRHLNIEVTKKCNQRCFYCFNDSGKGQSSDELSLQQWLDMLCDLKQKGLKSIHLTGGEPFAYKNAVELLAGVQALGLSTSILSNGLHLKWLTSEFPDVFRKLTVAQISLDSLDPQTHNSRRGNDMAWSDAISAIRALRQLSVPVEISCVISDTNLLDLNGLAEFCKTVGAALLIRPIALKGRAKNQKLQEGFAQNLADCSNKLIAQHGISLVSDRFHYVADNCESEIKAPNGIYTVHHDGRLRISDNDELLFESLAA